MDQGMLVSPDLGMRLLARMDVLHGSDAVGRSLVCKADDMFGQMHT